jgi:hypothetical protein
VTGQALGLLAVEPVLALGVVPVLEPVVALETVPLTFFFCWLPIVLRALRVASLLTRAVALVSTVLLAALGAFKPNVASVSGDCEYIPWTMRLNDDTKAAV